MRERALTLFLALGALALFYAMFMRGNQSMTNKRETSRPTSVDQQANGYSAVFAWLRHEGLRTLSLRRPWTFLEEDSTLPRTGNLLLLTLPGRVRIGSAEYAALRRWLAAGNTLLIAAAMSDDPDWAHSLGGLGRGDLGVLTGLDFESVRSRDSRRQPSAIGKLTAPRHSEAIANRSHPFFAGVERTIALSDYPPQARDVSIPFDGFVLELAHQRHTGEGTLWTREVRGGRVIVSAFGSLWTNRALGLGGNAQLLANIIGSNVAPGGSVIFDDAHQGVRPGYDPASFYRDPRLHATVGVALALWLIWVIGGTRLANPPGRARGLPESDLVDAGGSLFARVVPAHAAALRLIDLFALRIRSAGELWEFLERNPRVGEAELLQLRRWARAAAAGHRVPLVKLHNLLLSLESRLGSVHTQGIAALELQKPPGKARGERFP